MARFGAVDGPLKFDGSPFREIVPALAVRGHRPKSFGELIEALAVAEGDLRMRCRSCSRTTRCIQRCGSGARTVERGCGLD